MKKHILLYLKGVAMGAADVVPGVSGGTIAFISGIYDELLRTISSVDLEALKMLFTGRFAALFKKVNALFLIVLLSGIGTSLLSFAKLITYLLETHPIPVWSFFFGLIIASTVLVGASIKKWTPAVIISAIIGTGIAYWITSVAPSEGPDGLWFLFVSGAIAICAMILPGISGSFILLIMGKYHYVMKAVTELNFLVIFIFGSGCIVGILSFSRLLNYLLAKHHQVTIAVLMGFMVGSLNKVWPWKQVVETFTDSHGVEKPLLEANISPSAYESIVGQPAQLGLAIVFLVFGFFLVWGIEKIAQQIQKAQA